MRQLTKRECLQVAGARRAMNSVAPMYFAQRLAVPVVRAGGSLDPMPPLPQMHGSA